MGHASAEHSTARGRDTVGFRRGRKFKTQMLACILEADIPYHGPEEFFLVREFAFFHFVAEQIAEHAAKIFAVSYTHLDVYKRQA